MKFKIEAIFPFRRIIGVYFILIGLLIILNILFPNFLTPLVVVLSAVFILSTDIMIRSIISRKYSGLVAFSISVMIASLFALIIIIFKWDIAKIWPLFGLCATIGLVTSFAISQKKHISVLIPGIFIAIMSLLILCFTTGLIKNLNSKHLLFFTLSALFLFSGVLLICQNGVNKKSNKSEGNNDNNDDN